MIRLQHSLIRYDSHMIHRLLGQIYLTRNDTENALLHYEQVMDEFIFDPEFLKEIVLIYQGEGDMGMADKFKEKLSTISQ